MPGYHLHTQRIVALSACIIALGFSGRSVRADPGFTFGSDTNKNIACLTCHKDKEIVGTNRQIDQELFQHTTHAQLGCTTCHDAISLSHPKDGKVARTTTCSDCHTDIATQYSISQHSLSVTECSACHNPHTVHKPGEVHALEVNRTCTSCHNHDRISATHAQWLPQTNLHLGSISCVTCHTKSDDFVLSVYISKRDHKNSHLSSTAVADYGYLASKAGNDNIQQLVDRNLDNYISIEELKNFNNNPANKELYLKAILTPAQTSHAFQISDKSWNCTACHAAGPEAAQVSRLVLPNKDNTFRHMNIEKGASMTALNAIPDFYMMGSSRNVLLNKIGAVILVGGMVMPVGHGFLRFMTRKNRRREH